jgi:hypothetical protein
VDHAANRPELCVVSDPSGPKALRSGSRTSTERLGISQGLARSRLPGEAETPGDEQISWPTAERTAPDLACVAAVGYSVGLWIHGKKTVHAVRRRAACATASAGMLSFSGEQSPGPRHAFQRVLPAVDIGEHPGPRDQS